MGVAVLCAAMGMAGARPGGAEALRSAGPPPEPALVQAMKAYDLAQERGDRAALERLVADDYLIVHTGGLGNKAELIQSLAHPGLRNDPFTVVAPFTRNYGATVVAGGWVDLHGTDGGKPWDQKTRFADVWAKRKGRWWVVMTTLTPSEKP
jgi:hypothetical protein